MYWKDTFSVIAIANSVCQNSMKSRCFLNMLDEITEAMHIQHGPSKEIDGDSISEETSYYILYSLEIQEWCR